ncbi:MULTISPECIES: helix-turn-helix domain-containing protein [Thermogemmatispora]|uniref:helix-turn-helix domain-containing protein n=1 Tax=Thermogemmatispora TaxID=768669 RepID=UPI000852DF33|nr:MULTISPECIES: helix-turn-helix transcriptional regulator [Thermogemmatispora]
MIRLRVKEVAQAKGVSMSRLSRISDVNYKTIQQIWRDPFREVSIKTIEKLAKALEVPSHELIEDVPDEDQPPAPPQT